MIHSINGWIFFSPADDELREGYPKRTIAIKDSRTDGKFTIKCYDFPTCRDFRVEMNKMDMSGRLDSFEDAITFIKDFAQPGVTGTTDRDVDNSFGGCDDIQLTLDVNERGEPTRNGKIIDFQSDLNRLRNGGWM